MNFLDTALRPQILKAINELGFEVPTPIQEKAIPLILSNKNDIIGLAQTGTGKTAAFGLPILEQINEADSTVQALILCPTRELDIQITNDLEQYSKYLSGIKMTAVYGGAGISHQTNSLKKGSHIVIGTPGRTVDLIKRKALKIDKVKHLVLDEADEMLDMGFKEDLDFILSHTPEKKQTLLFSATMSREIRKIASNYMNNPEEISFGEKNRGADNVSHHYYITHAKHRYNVLKRIIDINPDIYGIIFCRTRSETKEIADKLIKNGYHADALHGDLSQAQRDFVMNRFRIKHIKLLVATDVAARGLDVTNLTHIINYNLPNELKAYVHRSGRTGRAGNKGISVSIVHTRELKKLQDIERIVGKQFQLKKVPDGFQVCEKQISNLADKIDKSEINEEKIKPYIDNIYKKLENFSREEIIKKFVSYEFNRFLEYYKDAQDLNANPNTTKQEKSKKNKAKEYSRYFINIGSKDGLTKPKMIGLINDNCNRRDLDIGKIDIMKNFSFFEVDNNHEKLVIESFKNTLLGNIEIKVQFSKPDSKKDKARKNKNDKSFNNKKKKVNNYKKRNKKKNYQKR